MPILASSLLAFGLLIPGAESGREDPPVAKADLKQLYRQLLPSTCWIIARDPATPGRFRMGTGWVSDASRRLVVTNEHVVRGLDEFEVYFPREQDGRVLVDPDDYLKRGKPIKATAIDRDRNRDLALMQLESLPDTAKSLTLAKNSPEPGERLLCIAGLPDGSEGLWVMTTGTVRLAYRRSIATGPVTGVVETDLPFNAGNSGGPVINEAGELVAVVEGYETKARQVSLTIDVNEVRKYLALTDPLVDPKDAKAFLDRGRRRHFAERWEVALADYGQALKLDPKLTTARLNRAWIFVHREDYDSAFQEFEAVLKDDPENASAYDGRGTCQRERGNLEAAISDMTQAIRRSPQDAALYFRRANTYRKQNELKKALADMDRAVQYDPGSADHWGSRGQVHRMLKNYQQAADDIAEAWKREPRNYKWLYEQAYVHMDFGNNDKAYALYSMAAELNGKEPRIFNNRGLVLNRLKRYDEALRDFSKAIELKPDRALYYEHAGDTLNLLGRHQDAIALFTKSIELDGKVASAYEGRGDAYKSLAEKGKNDPASALKNLERAKQDYAKAKALGG